MPISTQPPTVGRVWVLLVVIFVIVAGLMILNNRSRRRLERMGGDPGDPTRRFPWMRSGG